MKIGVFGRITDNTDLSNLVNFFTFLRQKEISFLVYRKYAKELFNRIPDQVNPENTRVFSKKEELADCKFIYCFGGDGTVLEAVRFTGRLGVPILGVNFGRLGYLTSISQKGLIQATEKLLKNKYRVDKRSLITVNSDPPGIFGDNKFGMNELTVHKSRTNEMINVHAYINGEFLNSFWGDGIIISTPTGSTAYNLSCGGPIIFPSCATFAITPVAPHALTVRPVVIPDDWVVSLEISARSGEAMVALDNRSELVTAGTSISVQKADFDIKLIRMSTAEHVDNLRKTLMWGTDSRG